MTNVLGSVAAFAVSALACLTPAAGAQRWEIGGKTGLSHVGVSSAEFEWSRSNSATGAFFRGILSERFAVSNELMMTRRVGVSVLPASTLSLVAEYVELPLMFQARLASIYGFAPFLAAGPSLILRTRCRLRFVGGGLSTDTVAAEDPMARRITMDAADVELRDVFAGIARAAGVPIVVSPLVRGRITIALTSVPVASALASIVDMARIAMTRSLESGEWVVRIDPLPRGER